MGLTMIARLSRDLGRCARRRAGHDLESDLQLGPEPEKGSFFQPEGLAFGNGLSVDGRAELAGVVLQVPAAVGNGDDAVMAGDTGGRIDREDSVVVGGTPNPERRLSDLGLESNDDRLRRADPGQGGGPLGGRGGAGAARAATTGAAGGAAGSTGRGGAGTALAATTGTAGGAAGSGGRGGAGAGLAATTGAAGGAAGSSGRGDRRAFSGSASSTFFMPLLLGRRNTTSAPRPTSATTPIPHMPNTAMAEPCIEATNRAMGAGAW